LALPSAGLVQSTSAVAGALPPISAAAVGPPALGPANAAPPAATPPGAPAKFVLAADPSSATVPIGIAVGLGIAGLATGFLVALGTLGKLGARRPDASG
jgi:hypothetical protein